MSESNDLTHNVTLYDENGNQVAVILDGSIYRLAVDVNQQGGVALQRFTPKFAFATPDLALVNGVDTQILLVTADVRIDFIQLVCKNASFETIIKINGVEELRIEQGELTTIGLLSSNSTGIPVYGASANKIFSLHPNISMDATTSFEILVKATAAGNELDGWFIKYRELV